MYDVSADVMARSLRGVAASGPALDLKPFPAILSNRSAATAVGYEMIWKITPQTNSPKNYDVLGNVRLYS